MEQKMAMPQMATVIIEHELSQSKCNQFLCVLSFGLQFQLCCILPLQWHSNSLSDS